MLRCAFACLFFVFGGGAFAGTVPDFELPPHRYWERPLNDPFTRLKTELEAGRAKLAGGGEKAFLLSLLAALEVPASSQMLVFSNTSLQLRLISPENPRALFFNEDVYVGFIPGGRIEVVSLDPTLGGIFYILDLPRAGEVPRIERSTRCMNCHADEETQHVPGLVIKSVAPGPRGGALDAFRKLQTGHAIPFAERFGGWYVTGRHGIAEHWGNAIGRFVAGSLTKSPIEPGRLFDYASYPVTGSDILPQLLHEHQVGFVNRTVAASYRARTLLQTSPLPAEAAAELDREAAALARYALFADETPLPAGGVEGDAVFKKDFLATRRATGGASLKDFDLQTRLFRYRCSYMLYSGVFQGLPAEMKQRVYRQLGEALSAAKPDAEYAYLSAGEKQAIRGILKATLLNLPVGW